MNNELFEWAIATFGSVGFENRTTKDGDYTFIVKEFGIEYLVPVTDRTQPNDFLFYMKQQELRVLQSELENLPHRKKRLQQNIKQLKSEMRKLMP